MDKMVIIIAGCCVLYVVYLLYSLYRHKKKYEAYLLNLNAMKEIRDRLYHVTNKESKDERK